MATVSNLLTTIIGDLQRSDTSLSDIVLIDVQSAIRDYETQRFYFNEQLMTVTLSATDTYALTLWDPAGVQDIIEVDFLNVRIGASRNYMLEEVTSRDFARLASAPSTAQGYPQYYALWNQAVKIFPIANAAGYVTELWGHVKFTEIAAGGYSTTNAWTNDASELIRNAALKRLWGRRFSDPERAQLAAVGEQAALKALQRRTSALAGHRLEVNL